MLGAARWKRPRWRFCGWEGASLCSGELAEAERDNSGEGGGRGNSETKTKRIGFGCGRD